MKPGVLNIKEIMNVSTFSGGIKTGRSAGNSDYSSLTDSQFLSGSQFWPDNSQSFSQEMSGQSRCSQHTPQDKKELMVSSSYSSKPLLFGGDGKFPNFTGGKASGMLDKFEEEKKKAKDKYEREILSSAILQLQGSLENVRETLINHFDGSSDMTRKVLAEKMDNISKTIEVYLSSVRESITCQFEALQSQTQKGMEDREAKASLAAKDLSSNMLNLQQDLEYLKAEQSKERGMLGDILSQLGALIAVHNPIAGSRSARMIDNEVQTSPGLLKRFCVMPVEKHYEGMMLYNKPVTCSGTACEQNLCPFQTSKTQNRNAQILSVQGQQQINQTVTEGFSSGGSQRLCYTQTVETSPSCPLVSAPSIEDPRGEVANRPLVNVEPEKLLHMKENKVGTYTDAVPPSKVLRRRQRALNFRGKKRALVLPQRQFPRKKGAVKLSLDTQQIEDLQNEQKDKAAISIFGDHQKITNKSGVENHLKPQQQATVAPVTRGTAEQPLNSFNVWFQDTNSSEMVEEHKMNKWETVEPKLDANVIKGDGLWQLFDFNNDSE